MDSLSRDRLADQSDIPIAAAGRREQFRVGVKSAVTEGRQEGYFLRSHAAAFYLSHRTAFLANNAKPRATMAITRPPSPSRRGRSFVSQLPRWGFATVQGLEKPWQRSDGLAGKTWPGAARVTGVDVIDGVAQLGQYGAS